MDKNVKDVPWIDLTFQLAVKSDYTYVVFYYVLKVSLLQKKSLHLSAIGLFSVE